MARCLIVGANGFMGSHLVDALAERGHDVTAFDRFSAPTTFAATGVTQVVGEFMNNGEVRDALSGQEYVFHFLSTTTPASAEDDPSLDVRTNIAASVELFEAAVHEGVSRVFFASTGGAIYGDQPHERITEDALPRPVSPYAIGKQTIEGYLRYFRRKHGLDSVTFRISNPYGTRQRANKKQGVIPIFLHNIAEGRPVTVYGDGSMVRDYIDVSDVARLVAEVVDRPAAHPVYNIGSGRGTSITEILDLAREITGRDVAVQHVARPVTFVERSVLDVTRYTSEFGLAASVPLRDGMERTWYDTLEQLA